MRLRRIGWRILQRAVDHPHHIVVDLLRGRKNFADGRKRLVGNRLVLGLVGLDLRPDEIAHGGQHVAITGDVGTGGGSVYATTAAQPAPMGTVHVALAA
jgi:hypothetical protein